VDAKTWELARVWAKGALTSRKNYALIKSYYEELFASSLTAGGLDSMTTGTKNAVSMGKQVGLSIPETLMALQRALEWADQGCIPSRTASLGRF
jgi:hypothetical protein